MKKLLYSSTLGVLILSTSLFGMGGPHSSIATGVKGDNNEVCVYCHTPHASNLEFSGASVTVPLWNKPSSKQLASNGGAGFKMYGATAAGVAGITTAGTATDAQPTDATLACLSCHDGISAYNSVINAPGSGGWNEDGSFIGDTLQRTMPAVPYIAVGVNGDLTDDHPLSVPYTPGRASLKALNAPLTNFWGGVVVGDLLRNGKVQCVSCHDPHYYDNGRYLRNANMNSELCLGCHDK